MFTKLNLFPIWCANASADKLKLELNNNLSVTGPNQPRKWSESAKNVVRISQGGTVSASIPNLVSKVFH